MARGLRITVPLAIVRIEERQLHAVARLGVVAVDLRLEQVVLRHAVMVGHDLPILLGAEQRVRLNNGTQTAADIINM